MTIAQTYADYQLWVTNNPRIFKIGTILLLSGAALEAKLLELADTSPNYTTSVSVINNSESLDGFLAWADQICGC